MNKTKLVSVLMCLLLAVPCAARTIIVDDDGPADFDNIKAAINDANNGDIVEVQPGTYTGPSNRDIDFLGKAITVRSTDPNDPNIIASTIIDCEANSGNRCRGVKFDSGEGANSILSGVTIRNGFGPNEWFGPNRWSAGGGIFCRGSSPTIRDCVISQNRVYTSSVLVATGGGLYIGNGSPIVSNCKFYSNNAESGGGIFVDFGGEPSIIGCTLSNNWTHFSGAGIQAFTRLTLKDSTITSNSAGNLGGGVYCEHGPIEISNCIIAENSAQQFGGGFCGGYINATIANCTIVGNWSLVSGGGVDFYFYSGGTIENCILWDNSSLNGPAISMRYPHAPSHVSVCYSDVKGGLDQTYVEPNNTLSYCVGNIDITPFFVDPNNNDYHLKSEGWRWDTQRKVWTWDDVTSRCIDAGNPGCPLGVELLSVPYDPDNEWGQNLRINMGAYGGTAEASMPPYDWALLANLTNDGKVDCNDLAVFVDYWLDSGQCLPSDLNRNQFVDFADFAIIAQNWLESSVVEDEATRLLLLRLRR